MIRDEAPPHPHPSLLGSTLLTEHGLEEAAEVPSLGHGHVSGHFIGALIGVSETPFTNLSISPHLCWTPFLPFAIRISSKIRNPKGSQNNYRGCKARGQRRSEPTCGQPGTDKTPGTRGWGRPWEEANLTRPGTRPPGEGPRTPAGTEQQSQQQQEGVPVG